VGAGNQSDQAFSPKTLAIVEKSKYSVFIVRDSRFSNIKARYFWNVIAPRLKENKLFYRLYINTLDLLNIIKSKQSKPRRDDDYFASKI
jgi:hypothetical protein